VNDYGRFDRFLHRMALGFRPLAELSFDLDQNRARPDRAAVAQGAHVFVAGLARAGTTILMRRIWGSGAFASLTYRNMPFVLAPNLWGALAGRKGGGEARERAHGDGILVSVDSPESLDEVFWRIQDGEAYIRPDHLVPHTPDAEVGAAFVGYIGAILKADPERRTRYLSKNNNNLLRIPALRRLLPQALILVPVRDPLSHANSLLKQHRNFVEQQGRDGFVRSYMTWLGHHEFGLDHRPFRLDPEGAARLAGHDPMTLAYWVEVWRQVYGWLEAERARDVTFVPYEDLCRDPAIWERVAGLCGIDPGAETTEPFALSATPAEGAVPGDLRREAEDLYTRLRTTALGRLT